MSRPPELSKIYHITHVNNLAGILTNGGMICDREMIRRGGPAQTIGMSAIKRRRIEEIDVACHPGTKVGDYVPFYFCPRSVMLYVISCANHPELAYREGQGPIVHLEADLHTVIDWADSQGTRWAFSLSNAGAYYVQFRARVDELDQLDWTSIEATDFRTSDVKEKKQAEFLVYGSFPFEIVDRIGVSSAQVGKQVEAVLQATAHRPKVEVRREWYF